MKKLQEEQQKEAKDDAGPSGLQNEVIDMSLNIFQFYM